MLTGGHQFNEDRTGLVPFGGSTYSHQQFHADMRHPYFESTGDNKTLANLSKPGAFNFPMDGDRWILTWNEFLKIRMSLGQVTFVEGSTPHAGMAYIHNPSMIVQWRPCGNFQVRSIRHRCLWDCVQPMTSYKTYCPPTHIGLIPERDFSNTIRQREYELQLIIVEAKKRMENGVDLDDYSKAAIEKYEPIIEQGGLVAPPDRQTLEFTAENDPIIAEEEGSPTKPKARGRQGGRRGAKGSAKQGGDSDEDSDDTNTPLASLKSKKKAAPKKAPAAKKKETKAPKKKAQLQAKGSSRPKRARGGT